VIAYSIALFGLGVLVGSVVGGAYTLKELQRRYLAAYRRLRDLHDNDRTERA